MTYMLKRNKHFQNVNHNKTFPWLWPIFSNEGPFTLDVKLVLSENLLGILWHPLALNVKWA